jgi:DNA-binding transcriptional LysR family regulator
LPILQRHVVRLEGRAVLDRFTLMKSFTAVVRDQSFAAAARALGISRALVSRHIADLERQLGVRLVNRTTRSVSLTEAGTRYFAFSKRVLTEIAEEDAAILGIREKAEGELSVISPKWIGVLDLGDAISRFAVEQPRIRVRLELGGMSDRTYDFIESGYDIAFHTKYMRNSAIRVRKIATLEFALCASPGYIKRFGELRSPTDLAQHKCLLHTNDPVWHIQQGERVHHFKPDAYVFSSNTYLILQKAAVHGMGIALLPLRTAMSDVGEGRLQILLENCSVPDRPLYAAYSPGTQTVKKVRLFIDFIAEWFRRHPMQKVDSREAALPPDDE